MEQIPQHLILKKRHKPTYGAAIMSAKEVEKQLQHSAPKIHVLLSSGKPQLQDKCV